MKNRDEKTGVLGPFGEAAITEFAAESLGDEAYSLEDESLRQNLEALTRENDHGDGSRFVPPPPALRVDGHITSYPAVRRVYVDYGSRINKAWRTWQVTGWSPWILSWGLRFRGNPEAFMPDVVQAYRDTDQPLLAYIGGDPDFYLRPANYQSGETIRKTAVFVWDGPGDHALQATWQAMMDGKPVASGNLQQNLQPHTVTKLPIEFPAPTVEQKGALSLVLQVTSHDGPGTHDQFDITLWPAPKAPVPPARKIFLYDPGAESGWVSQLAPGATVLPAGTAPAAGWGDAVLILGRRSLHSLTDLPYTAGDIEKGLRVIVLEQEQADLLRLGFRSVESVVRQGVSTFPGNAVVNGMTDADFRNWRGDGSLLPEEDGLRWWSDLEQLNPWQPARGARWGTHGSIASVLIETPQKGSFRPLLRCGFDQSYTPLLEWRHGAGGVWFSQLDLTGRVGTEPAATQVASNLLAYVTQDLPPVNRDISLGNIPATYADQFKNLGFKMADQPGNDTLQIGLAATAKGTNALRIVQSQGDAAATEITWKSATAFSLDQMQMPTGDLLPPNLRRFRLPVQIASDAPNGEVVRLDKSQGKIDGFIGVPLTAADGPYTDDIEKNHARLSRWRIRQLYDWVLNAAGVESGADVSSRVTTLTAPIQIGAPPKDAPHPNVIPLVDVKISQALTIPGLQHARLLNAPDLPTLNFKDQKSLSAAHDVLTYGGDKAEGVYIDLSKLLDVKPSEDHMAVLKANVHLDKSQRLAVRLGVDFFGTVTLNGQELLRVDAQKIPPHRDSVRALGDFQPGDNELVIRVVSGVDGFGCWIDVDDDLSLTPLRAADQIGQPPFLGRPMLPYDPAGYSLYCEPMRKRDDPYAWLSW